MANVPNGVETLPNISIAWKCTNVTDRRQTDGRATIANVIGSSRSLKMTIIFSTASRNINNSNKNYQRITFTILATSGVSRVEKSSTSHSTAEHVSGAWAAKKPLCAPTYFYNPRSPLRSHSTTSRSTLRSIVFLQHPLTAPLRFTRFSARSAPTIKLRPRTNGGQINHGIYC